MFALITHVCRLVQISSLSSRASLYLFLSFFSLEIHPDPITHDLSRIVRYSSKNVSAFYRPSWKNK